jgi:hypothetical protein
MAPAEARKRLKAYVEHYRDHPALGFWYFYDEPAPPKAPSELISGWKTFLKGLAPEVPTAICLKWDKTFREYRNSADILLADTYPVAGEPFPEAQIHLATRFHRECLKLGRPFMPVQQLINWKAYAPKDAEVFRGNAVEDLRFPDREELRYWFYSSAAIGCRGVFWYNFSRGAAGPDGRQWLAEVFAPVCREFRQFVDTVAPAWRRTQLHYATDEDLVISLWQRQAGTYLVCINEYPATKNINRRMEGLLDGGRLEPWGSTRDAGATLENGRLSVEAGPWEVFVWRVLPAETDGPITE